MFFHLKRNKVRKNFNFLKFFLQPIIKLPVLPGSGKNRIRIWQKVPDPTGSRSTTLAQNTLFGAGRSRCTTPKALPPPPCTVYTLPSTRLCSQQPQRMHSRPNTDCLPYTAPKMANRVLFLSMSVMSFGSFCIKMASLASCGRRGTMMSRKLFLKGRRKSKVEGGTEGAVLSAETTSPGAGQSFGACMSGGAATTAKTRTILCLPVFPFVSDHLFSCFLQTKNKVSDHFSFVFYRLKTKFQATVLLFSSN